MVDSESEFSMNCALFGNCVVVLHESPYHSKIALYGKERETTD